MKTSGFCCETKFGRLVFLGHPTCQDGLEYFFPTFAHLTEGRGGGSTAIETTHFKKGLPNWQLWDVAGSFGADIKSTESIEVPKKHQHTPRARWNSDRCTWMIIYITCVQQGTLVVSKHHASQNLGYACCEVSIKTIWPVYCAAFQCIWALECSAVGPLLPPWGIIPLSSLAATTQHCVRTAHNKR